MDVTCEACATVFHKPKLKPGDATMCPRCRSLVVVRAAAPAPPPAEPAPPPPPPTPPPLAPGRQVKREPRSEPGSEPGFQHRRESAAAEPSEPLWVPEQETESGQESSDSPTSGSAKVSLRRACPWCRGRYDVELPYCPRCRYSAARAQMLRNQAEEEGTTAPRPDQAQQSPRLGLVGYAVLAALWLAFGSGVRHSGSLVLLLLLGLIWLASRVKPGGGSKR